tara:strand:- start:446 stop:877 length:432 start_codon:yes stop_codon:yes gene_type:complete
MRGLTSFISGSLFGIGLLFSGMTDTSKVQGWLDLFGNWDPTLAFVMGGAIVPMFFAWRYSKGRKPIFGDKFPDPQSSNINPDLIIGSVLFGMGWGLAGLCPGPALASLGFGGSQGLVFVLAMLCGMGATPTIKSLFPSYKSTI